MLGKKRVAALKPYQMTSAPAAGFALPIAIALGLMMIAFAGTSLLVAQGARNTGYQRKMSGAALLVSDSAVARAMLQLSNPNNAMLLVRNYDPINPETGQNYLGVDGLFGSGDETVTPTDEWTGYDPSGVPCFQQMGWSPPNIALTGTISPNESYTILAYRYSKKDKTGMLLVEGNYQGQRSKVAVTLSIEPVLDNFPGVLGLGERDPGWFGGNIGLRGRKILGRKANVYYYPRNSADPSLTAYSKPGDIARPSYLSAIYNSGAQDGANGDSVDQTIYACRLMPRIPFPTTGVLAGSILTSQTLSGTGGTTPTVFQVDKIALANSDNLTIDTTGGPVVLNITDDGNDGRFPTSSITLRNNAKILNARTDGQPPRVGDFRILIAGNSLVSLYDQSCIQNAFLFSVKDELRLLTAGPGCPGGQNTNFEGVVWAEDVFGAKNSDSNRSISTYISSLNKEFDTLVIPGATSGVAVPDDVTSLSDLLEFIDLPVRYKYGTIQSWQRVS